MKMTEETRKLLNAEKDFEKRGHKATLIQNSDRYTIIDWRRSDGNGDYYVNYIIDKKRGSLIISGDLGDCIATWYNPNSVHNIAEYVRDVHYFISKFQCSSDCYDYDEDDIIADIDRELKEAEVERTEEFNDAWDVFQYDVGDCIINQQGFFPNRDATEFLEKYLGDDWWDGGESWGRSVNMHVYLWVAGLNMAVDQLDEAGLLSEED